MIADGAWVDRYVEAMRARLGMAYRATTARLEGDGVRFLPSGAGFFLVLDLRRFLPEPGWKGEHRLWRRLLEEANVNLTPGAACRVAEPGFMRLCFASVPGDHLQVGLDRLVEVLGR
jgi:DNA-binding transcriptional MocR family regulator